MTSLGPELEIGASPQRVDGAVPAGDGAARRFGLPQPELETPVEPFAVLTAFHVLEGEPATDVPDLWVGKVPGEKSKRRGLQAGIRIREGEQIGRGGHDRCILRRNFALPRQLEETHAPIREAGDLGRRPVGGAVRGDEDLEAARVVEREGVLQGLGDLGLLVVRGDHKCRVGRKGAIRPGAYRRTRPASAAATGYPT